jgi:hypothetical protein
MAWTVKTLPFYPCVVERLIENVFILQQHAKKQTVLYQRLTYLDSTIFELLS